MILESIWMPRSFANTLCTAGAESATPVNAEPSVHAANFAAAQSVEPYSRRPLKDRERLARITAPKSAARFV